MLQSLAIPDYSSVAHVDFNFKKISEYPNYLKSQWNVPLCCDDRLHVCHWVFLKRKFVLFLSCSEALMPSRKESSGWEDTGVDIFPVSS